VALPGGGLGVQLQPVGMLGAIKDLNKNTWTFGYTSMGKNRQ
jgi:hypothetical protein